MKNECIHCGKYHEVKLSKPFGKNLFKCTVNNETTYRCRLCYAKGHDATDCNQTNRAKVALEMYNNHKVLSCPNCLAFTIDTKVKELTKKC